MSGDNIKPLADIPSSTVASLNRSVTSAYGSGPGSSKRSRPASDDNSSRGQVTDDVGGSSDGNMTKTPTKRIKVKKDNNEGTESQNGTKVYRIEYLIMLYYNPIHFFITRLYPL